MKKLIVLMTILSLAAWAGPVAAAEVGGVNIHGFISQGFLYSDGYNYLANDTEDGSFEYNEAGINFSKQLTDKLRIGLQLFSRDIGDAANNKVTLDWAYADYRQWDWLGLRAGRIKLPVGLYNETRDMDMLRTSIVLPQGIYNDLLRDNLVAINGVGLYGNVDMKGAGGLEYQLIAGAINSDEDSGVGKYLNDGLASSGGEANGAIVNDTSYAGALRWETPLAGLKLGYSIFRSDVEVPVAFGGGAIQGALEGPTTLQVYSAEYLWNNLSLAAEYMQRRNVSTMALPAPFPSPVTTTNSESYYLSASYRFVDWFTLGAYYSEYYPNTDDRDGENEAIDHTAWEKDLALTLRFDINEYWIFKIEGHAVDGTANVLAVDNAGNDYSNNNWYYGAAKLTFNF
ncbi:MAG: hypothetical protein HY911_08100 [Desulfobacterales bacterium]|nr:hypothetical protein [Desulfobacterales bacterium]